MLNQGKLKGHDYVKEEDIEAVRGLLSPAPSLSGLSGDPPPCGGVIRSTMSMIGAIEHIKDLKWVLLDSLLGDTLTKKGKVLENLITAIFQGAF